MMRPDTTDPSLHGLDVGPFPGGWAWLVAILAPLAAAFLAAGSRGRLEDGLETGTWAALLSGLTMSIMVMAATYRVLPAPAAASRSSPKRTGTAWPARRPGWPATTSAGPPSC